MTQRTERFPPDGKRRLAPPASIVTTWRAETKIIPAQFALGSAAHEASLTINEVDVEPNGYSSLGIYQVGTHDPAAVDLAGVDVFSLEGCTRVFVRLCTRNLYDILGAAKIITPRVAVDAAWEKYPPLLQQLDGLKLPVDVWAYLSIAHNQGDGAAVKTIERYGLDWAKYKKRNLDEARAKKDAEKLRWFTKVASYGDDVITGGTHWRKAFEVAA